MIFYTMVTIVSTVAFTIDIILRYMEKIRSFGMEARLHNIKGRIIPTEDFIPHNITFAVVRFLRRIRSKPIPKDADLSGTEAVCTVDIDGDSYGEIEFHYNNRKYTRPALSENETDIKKGEKVLVIMMNEDLCFVEKPDEVIDILNQPE